jgi:hypothetical protein
MSHKEDFALYSSSLSFILFDTLHILNLFAVVSAEMSFQTVLIHCTSSASNGHASFMQVLHRRSQVKYSFFEWYVNCNVKKL